MRYLSGLPANSVYDISIGKIINKDSAAYKRALAQGYAEDIYTTDLGRIHRLRKSGAFSKK